MELRRHLNPKALFIAFYFLAFALYLVIGLQPADATNYNISTILSIPSISLESDVTEVELKNRELKTPDDIVGSFSNHDNKTFLFGHYGTVFSNLGRIHLNDEIFYQDKTFIVKSIGIYKKERINMDELLKESETETIVIMTCAGKLLDNNDSTHRLVVTAEIK